MKDFILSSAKEECCGKRIGLAGKGGVKSGYSLVVVGDMCVDNEMEIVVVDGAVPAESVWGRCGWVEGCGVSCAILS